MDWRYLWMKQRHLTDTKDHYIFGWVTVAQRGHIWWRCGSSFHHLDSHTVPLRFPVATLPVPLSPFSPTSNASVHLLFPALITSGVLGKRRNPVTRHSKKKKKRKKKRFSWTFPLYSHCQFSFIRLQIFFFSLFTWKGDTKIWLCTGGGRRLRFSSLSVRFGNFFFFPPTSESESSSCCKLCSHPRNGTSQLEWTKVHRWVGEGQGASAQEWQGGG